MAEAFYRAAHAYPEVDATTAARFQAVMHDLALFMQGAFALWESGALEDETYHAYLDFFATNVSSPGGAAWWSRARAIYMQRMVQHFDDRLARGDIPELLETPVYRPAEGGPTATS
jgi:hypothetical protein